MAAHDIDAPPAGEELHLPDPSLVPILNAAAVALTLVGLTTTYYLTVVGGILFLVTLVKWILDATHDISELPADHRGAQ
jgi:hypothetical protein